MQLSVALLLLVHALHSVVSADPKVVALKTRRKPTPALDLRRRAFPTEQLWNERTLNLYEIDIRVGTPPQFFTLDIDTGSSDIWLFSDAAVETCAESLCLGGTYEPGRSSTYQPSDDIGPFSIGYVDGAAVNGTYFQDQLTLGNVTINNATLALGTTLVDWHTKSPSIMGIGFEHLEGGSGQALYPGITRLMVEQGLINTRSYSLWLDDVDASTGTLLFGGYDTSKFIDDLTVLPIQASAGGVINEMLVQWSGLTYTNSSTSIPVTESAFPMQALLDSGTTFMLVPEALYTQATVLFNTYSDARYGATLVNCDQPDGTLDFSFGGGSTPLISVPFSEIAPPAYNNFGDFFRNEDGTLACEFGIGQSENGQIILGDTFLRSAYVVYELDSAQIGMAQSNFNADEQDSNIVEIQTGTKPFVTAAKSAAGRSTASSTWALTMAVSAVLATVSLLSYNGSAFRGSSLRHSVTSTRHQRDAADNFEENFSCGAAEAASRTDLAPSALTRSPSIAVPTQKLRWAQA